MERARETAPSSFSFKSHPQMPIEKQMEKLSPQVRIFALAAALAAVGGLLFVFMAGRGAAAEPELAAPPAAAVVAKKPTAPAVHKAAAPKAKVQAAKVQAAKVPAAKAQAPKLKASKAQTPHKAAPTKVVPKVPPTGFPLAVDRALAKHKVVVVSSVPGLWDDSPPVRRRRERSSAVPAIALNVLNERVAHAVLAKLEGVKEPSLLVLKRSARSSRGGFVDRETVAQPPGAAP
jgi:hypothetical protein